MLNKFAQTKTKSQAIAIQNPKEATGNILGLRHNSESWQRPNLSQSSSQQMQGQQAVLTRLNQGNKTVASRPLKANILQQYHPMPYESIAHGQPRTLINLPSSDVQIPKRSQSEVGQLTQKVGKGNSRHISTTGRNTLLSQTNFPKKKMDESLFLIGPIQATKPKVPQPNFSENQYGLHNPSAKSFKQADPLQSNSNIVLNISQKIKRTDSSHALKSSNFVPAPSSATFVKTSKN